MEWKAEKIFVITTVELFTQLRPWKILVRHQNSNKSYSLF